MSANHNVSGFLPAYSGVESLVFLLKIHVQYSVLGELSIYKLCIPKARKRFAQAMSGTSCDRKTPTAPQYAQLGQHVTR